MSAARAALVCFGVAVFGCGDDPSARGSTGSGTGGGEIDDEICDAGHSWLDGVGCRAAGVPDGVPAVGPRGEVDAGVPEGACGDGFVSDGARGCTPILPDAPCADGFMAVPGDATCRPVADCGVGVWGDIPLESDTVYVDQAFVGVSDGSAAAPFTAIQDAIDAAPALQGQGGQIAIAAGVYLGALRADVNPVRIWGRCPELVHVTGVMEFGLIRAIDAPGFELHTLTVSGTGVGIGIYDAPGSTLDRVHIGSDDSPGVVVAGVGPETVIRDSLIDGAWFSGVVAGGAAVAVERCEIRATQPFTGVSRAVHGQPDGGVAASLRIDGSHLHDLDEAAVASFGATTDLRRTVISDVRDSAQSLGYGIAVRVDEGLSPATTMSQSVFRRITGIAVRSEGGELIGDAITAELGILPTTPGYDGAAIAASEDRNTLEQGVITLTRSTVRDNVSLGIDIDGADVLLDRVLVQRTAASPNDGYGVGVLISPMQEGTVPASVTMDRCIVEHNEGTGVLVASSSAWIRDSFVRDTPLNTNGEYAIGVMGSLEAGYGFGADVTLEHTAIERSSGAAVYLAASRGELVGVLVRDVTLVSDEVSYGVAAFGGEGEHSELVVSGSRVEGVERLGLFAYASMIEVTSSLFSDVRGSGGFARGVELQNASGALRWSRVEQVAGIGVSGWSADLLVEGVHIHDIRVAEVGNEGIGLLSAPTPGGTPASVTAQGCRIERATTAGATASTSALSLDAVLIQDSQPTPDGRFGRGIIAQEGAALTVTRSRVERTFEVGIHLIRSHATIRDTRVEGVLPALDDGTIGDGILAALGVEPLVIDGVHVDGATRAALSAFGAEVLLSNSQLRCSALNIGVETYEGIEARVDDRGGNVCGCDEDVPCKAMRAGVAPPEPLP